MAWTGYQFFLAGLLVFTGSINTLATKWADRGVAPGRPDGVMRNGTSTLTPHTFQHAFLQALGMFIGEFTCLVVFKLLLWRYVGWNGREDEDQDTIPSVLRGSRTFNPLIFLPPTLCDMIGTTTMYVGLTLTFASSAQMFRGAVILFTGLFSMIFLKRQVRLFQWIGILFVLVGLAIVGAADIVYGGNTSGAPNVFLGDVLIVCAQVVTATQMVLEEKFVVGSNVPPLQAVGWEGLFGILCMGMLLIPLNFIHYHGAPIEDSIDGLYQMYNSPQIAGGFFGTVLSISFFNFAGVSITKEISATTRMVLDSVRIIVIWSFTVLFKWQSFIPLTLAGFFVLVLGMKIYNRIIKIPCLPGYESTESAEIQERRLIEDED
ncbi:solute carrier family 35 member F6 [Galendromus occidentalis]|uniref:Solute carrier family 35 member F6 n=1 Tax=Galendromus occidentalis TaxID=34638 RepID=A0AAJ6QRI9_9ACAR|nr:solute carrier family 35 member F6 [Galendromus occidentalis]